MIKWFDHTFLAAARIAASHRSWFLRQSLYKPLHPAVKKVLVDDHRPRQWQQLLLEWPYVAKTDPTRLAYTRDERAGEANRQTLTTVGKYLMRHFDLPDHVIRDYVALHAAHPDGFKFIYTTDEMVHAVKNGPYSCMCWADRDGVLCRDGVERHPYAVYAPEYGWHMALQIEGDTITGRALCNTDSDGNPYFVRSYKRKDGGYSHANEALEAWLKEHGYSRANSWHRGARFACFPTSDYFLAPYIDGGEQYVDVVSSGGVSYLQMAHSDGEYACDNTDGTPDHRGSEECEDCGERVNEDDITYVGYNEDMRVCRCCIENDYVYVYGRRGYQYYVHRHDAVYVDSQNEYYDDNYLDSNSIVQLANGDYEHTDNVVVCDDDREWYHAEDDDIVYCDYDSRYHLADNCVNTEDEGYVHQDDAWQCAGSSNWYSDNTDYVEVDGEKYHPDHVPATETNTQE